ncbi:hypothetical protein ACFSN5_07255 [Streptococcus tangpeifui]|uniref:hypothetical protein n=1 Tax=Streptococcus tangpeifui TaxID=2709400 RepID=UPI001F150993|nr:hypothetical protein [Streptococcus sp. ZJ1593]
MMLTKLIMGSFGSIEIVANLIFLLRFFEKRDFQYAQVFHGDLPKSASQKAWLLKITASFVLGLIALAGTLLLLVHLTSVGLVLYYLFIRSGDASHDLGADAVLWEAVSACKICFYFRNRHSGASLFPPLSS